MNDLMASNVTKLLDGSTIENYVQAFYLVLAVVVGLVLFIRFVYFSNRLRSNVVIALVLIIVATGIGYVGTPTVRRSAARQGKLVLELAQSNRLVAEASPNEGKVILREQRTELLFGKPVITSSWSREVDIEDARKLSDYLAKMNQGNIVWNVAGQSR